MKIIMATMLVVSFASGCSEKSKSLQRARDDDDTTADAAASSPTFVCEWKSIYCKEHLGAKSWAPAVSSACEKNGGSWSKGSCPKDRRYATCTVRYEDRSTVSYFYADSAMVAESAAIVCKEGVWTPPSAEVEAAPPNAATARAAAGPANRPAARPLSARTAPARSPAPPPPRAADVY